MPIKSESVDINNFNASTHTQAITASAGCEMPCLCVHMEDSVTVYKEPGGKVHFHRLRIIVRRLLLIPLHTSVGYIYTAVT